MKVAQVYVAGDLVVLIADVSLQSAQIEILSSDNVAVRRDFLGGSQIDVDVGSIRCVEIGETKDALAVVELVDRHRAGSIVRCGYQAARFERSRRCRRERRSEGDKKACDGSEAGEFHYGL